MLSTWPSAFSFPWVLTPYLTDDAHRLVLCSRLSHYLLNVPYYKDLYYGAQPPPRINHHSVSLSIFFVTSLSPDVMVHVAQRRHELKGLGELHDLRRTDMYHLDQQWWHSATETALHEKKKGCMVTTSKMSHGWVDVFEEKHGAAFTLQQGERSLHDLPDNLLQVGLLLEQVVDHLQQSLWPPQRTLMTCVHWTALTVLLRDAVEGVLFIKYVPCLSKLQAVIDTKPCWSIYSEIKLLVSVCFIQIGMKIVMSLLILKLLMIK